MPIRNDVDLELRKIAGSGGYTTSGTTGTITGTLTHAQIQELLDKATVAKHDIVLTAGVLKVQQR